MELTEAYAECERITWTQARNFAYGIRLLPPGKRRGLAVIYAFARRIDDIGDGAVPGEQAAMPAAEKIAALEQARRQVLDLSRAPQDDPVLLALADVERTFPVPIEAFGELIDGCVADVRGTSYATFEDLLYYCRCVAGSIGRLSLGIFGTRRDGGRAARLADSLGVALQLTNILRDIREDEASGRVYLPAEDLAKFDLSPAARGGTTALAPGGDPFPERGAPAPRSPRTPHANDPDLVQFARLVDFEVQRARDWYATGLRLLPMLDWRSAACTGAMAGIYQRLLDRIAAQPEAVLNGRLSLPAGEKAAVAVKALARRIR